MTPVAPRWEWRTFDEVSRAAAIPLLGRDPLQIHTSDEIYLLSPLSEASVKIREGRLDAKCLEQRDENGLELWRPILSTPFPINAAIVGEVLELLHIPASSCSRDAGGPAEFINACVAIGPCLRAVRVHKTRALYGLGDCRAEITDVYAAGRSLRTLAVESENPQAVIAAVDALGLRGRPNQNYPLTLRTLIGMPMSSVPAR